MCGAGKRATKLGYRMAAQFVAKTETEGHKCTPGENDPTAARCRFQLGWARAQQDDLSWLGSGPRQVENKAFGLFTSMASSLHYWVGPNSCGREEGVRRQKLGEGKIKRDQILEFCKVYGMK